MYNFNPHLGCNLWTEEIYDISDGKSQLWLFISVRKSYLSYTSFFSKQHQTPTGVTRSLRPRRRCLYLWQSSMFGRRRGAPNLLSSPSFPPPAPIMSPYPPSILKLVLPASKKILFHFVPCRTIRVDGRTDKQLSLPTQEEKFGMLSRVAVSSPDWLYTP